MAAFVLICFCEHWSGINSIPSNYHSTDFMWQAVHITSPPPFFSMTTSGSGAEFGIAVAQCMHTSTHRDMLHPLVSPSSIRIYPAFIEKEIKRGGERQEKKYCGCISLETEMKGHTFYKILSAKFFLTLIRNLSHFLSRYLGHQIFVGCDNARQSCERYILLFSDTCSSLVSPHQF